MQLRVLIVDQLLVTSLNVTATPLEEVGILSKCALALDLAYFGSFSFRVDRDSVASAVGAFFVAPEVIRSEDNLFLYYLYLLIQGLIIVLQGSVTCIGAYVSVSIKGKGTALRALAGRGNSFTYYQ